MGSLGATMQGLSKAFGLKGFMGLTCSSSYGFRGSGVLSLVPRFWCSRSGL